MANDDQFYASDPYDPDPPAPLRDPNAPTFEETELSRLREALFTDGSSYGSVRREEIVGIDSVLDRIDVVVHWLKHHEEYLKFGARLEPGIIFAGPPGTGKTLVSRYIASESGALFVAIRDYPINGAFLTAQDIRVLFNLARETYKREQRPVVLFWDEFEGSAVDRAGYNTDKEQIAAVSQLTSELDGVLGKNEGLLVIGCTNYGDSIDAALKRPGRMGLHIDFQAPDLEGKRVLLEYYLNKVYTIEGIDPSVLAVFFEEKTTASGIEEAVAEAWRLAVYRSIQEGQFEKPQLIQDDLLEVFLGRMIGPRPTFSNLSDEAKLRVAVHESSHGIAALAWRIPIKLITIRPGKDSLGATFTASLDSQASTVAEAQAHLRLDCAPLIGEEISGLGHGMGSGGDTKNASKGAASLAGTQGVGTLTGFVNPVGYASTRGRDMTPSISEAVLSMVDKDAKELLDLALKDNKRLFDVIGREDLLEIAGYLVDEETMTGPEFERVVQFVLGENKYNLFLAVATAPLVRF